MKDNTKNGWTLIGRCAVDSGQLMVCDPCYIGNNWKENEFTSSTDEEKNDFSYDGACVTTLRHTAGELEGGTACVTSTTYGDGRYPVYVRYENGSPMELRIMLDGALLSNDGRVVGQDECHDCGNEMTEGSCDWCAEDEDEDLGWVEEV
jgi:hypothetical protein